MKTPLYDIHKAAGARIVDYAGWQMPVQYAGVIAEHKAVRSAAGLFDVSHMGEVMFAGPDALDVVNRLITNDLRRVKNGRAQYTTICNHDGHILDDAICYRLSEEEILVVVNAANKDKMVAWFSEHSTGKTCPADVSNQWALLALQGPAAPAIGARVFEELEGMRPFRVKRMGSKLAATTGYTGEPGFELFVPVAEAADVWQALMAAGEEYGLVPVGLGARDTLRLDKCYALYGNDIDETTNPLEAGLGWVVRLNKAGGFIGQQALLTAHEAGARRRLVGLRITGRGIARHGYGVHLPDGKAVGRVTSGTRSPTLGEAIAMAYVDTPHHSVGTSLCVEMRGRLVEAVVSETPFYDPKLD